MSFLLPRPISAPSRPLPKFQPARGAAPLLDCQRVKLGGMAAIPDGLPAIHPDEAAMAR